MVAERKLRASRCVSSSQSCKAVMKKENIGRRKDAENKNSVRKKEVEDQMLTLKESKKAQKSSKSAETSVKNKSLVNGETLDKIRNGDEKEAVNGETKEKRKNGNEKERKRPSKEAVKVQNERKESKNASSVQKVKRENVSDTKNSNKSDDAEDYDFSKIESIIFEGHSQSPKEKNTTSGKGKGRSKKEPSSSSSRKSTKKEGKGTEHASESRKGKAVDQKKKSISATSKGRRKEKMDVSDSDASDWEEVDENNEINELEALLNDSLDTKLSVKESVKIELEAPDVLWGMKKRKKRRTEEEMIEDYLRRTVNRSIKEVYENMHKAHVLCLLAHGQFINKTLNSEILMGSALSIITEKNAYPPKRLDMEYLEKFVSWFARKIKVLGEDLEEKYWDIPLEELLVKRFESKTALTNRELVFMFVIIARALGMNVRLIMSLQPMSWKPSADALIKRIKGEKSSIDTGVKEEKKSIETNVNASPSTSINAEAMLKKEKPKVKNNRKMLSSDSDIDNKLVKGKKNNKSPGSKRPLNSDDDDDSDFDPVTPNIKKGSKISGGVKRKNSSSGNKDSNKKRKMNDEKAGKDSKRKSKEPFIEWAEIYVEEEEKWMCIDVTKAKIHCILEIEARTPSTSGYITAFNVDLTVKDVSRRYISTWLSSENKLRCDSEWWQKSIKGFRGRRTRLDKEEDEEMDQILRQQPLPKSIGEYKNHPLYALQRHLLKFEAIYPPDETPVGFIKGEPVFPRSSVYTLHSRDIWMKEAKTVRVEEEPYKVVKARPKWDRETCQVIKDRPLEVFGVWQVEDYEPPVAVGGKVPRNEYGNVELFKPSMLPKGCVHLPIAGLNRIARKLNIDCASAITGFDFHSGWSHPVYEGFVVCEEFKDTLLDAWNQDQVEQAKRAEEKREKRIYDNWKKLIRGMLVRERVREKYGSYEVPEEETKEQNEDESEKDQGNHKKGKKSEKKKPKITQEDIDAARPPLLTHSIKNLQIDLTSNVVEMAKASRSSSMKTKNARKAKQNKEIEKSSQLSTANEGCLDDSSDETDEEERKEKIRAILQWGTKAANAASNLSDDSDGEEDAKPSSSKLNASSFLSNPLNLEVLKKAKKFRKFSQKHSRSDSEEEKESNISSRSTTPEAEVKDLSDVVPRRALRRSAKQKTVQYEESGESDISLDESDVEDKTFNPFKGKSDGLNLSDSD